MFNWGGWKYPEVDALIDNAGKELDRTKRLAFQTEALTKIKDDIAFLPLHQQPMAWAMGPKIDSIVQLTDNKPRFWLTKMK